MKKTLPIVLVLAVIGLGLVFGRQYLTRKGPVGSKEQLAEESAGQQAEEIEDQQKEVSSRQQEANEQQEGEGFIGKTKEALGWAWGKSAQCTWKSEEGAGTYYIKGEKIRADLEVSGQKVNMIWVDGCSYTWGEMMGGATQGVKICPEGQEDIDQPPDIFEQQDIPDVSFDCKPAVIPDSKFNLPEGIDFLSIPAMG